MASLKRAIHKIDSESFQGTPAIQIRLIVGHRNHRNTSHELVPKRAHPSLLKPIQLPRKIYFSYSTTFSSIHLYFLFDTIKQKAKRRGPAF